MGFQRVTAKLGSMRKERDWSVSPSEGDKIMVQSDGAIGLFDWRTGNGVLNTKGGYFPHLSPALGAKPFEFPKDFVVECMKVCPSLGGQTELAGGAIIVEHTVRGMKI